MKQPFKKWLQDLLGSKVNPGFKAGGLVPKQYSDLESALEMIEYDLHLDENPHIQEARLCYFTGKHIDIKINLN